MNNPTNIHTDSNPIGRFMVAAGAVIELNQTGKILLIQRANNQDWHHGDWEVIYGRIAQGEDLLAGLRREVLEEVGISDLVVGQILRSWHVYRGEVNSHNEVIGVTYYCQVSSETVQLSAEHDQYRWVDLDTALTLIKNPGIRTEIELFAEVLSARSANAVDINQRPQVGVGALIFNDRQELLLSRRGPAARNEVDKWEIPGGAIEFGETLVAGLKREVREELGVEIEVIEPVQVWDHILEFENQHWVSPTYICRITEGEPKIQEPLKASELGWYSLEAAAKLPLAQVTRQDVEFLLAHPTRFLSKAK